MPAELEAVALRGEHADAAVAALERLEAPSDETLTGSRSARGPRRCRSAPARCCARATSRRPRPRPTPAVDYKEADQQRARELADQMEAHRRGARHRPPCARRYAALRVAWVELLADAEIRARARRRASSSCPIACASGSPPTRPRARGRAARAGAGARAGASARRSVRRDRGAARRRHRSIGWPRRARRGKACRRCRRRGRPSCSSASTRPAAPPRSGTSGASPARELAEQAPDVRRRDRSRGRDGRLLRPMRAPVVRAAQAVADDRARAGDRSPSWPRATSTRRRRSRPREQEHREGRSDGAAGEPPAAAGARAGARDARRRPRT